MYPFSLLQLLFIILFISPPAATFSLSQCYQQVYKNLTANPDLGLNSTFFFFTPADSNDPFLTPTGCEVLCGHTDDAIYSDCALRLFQWVFPVIILIGSIPTPPTKWWKRFWVMLRVLGDPIDALLSMVYVLYTNQRCYAESAEPARLLGGRAHESDQGEQDTRPQPRRV